MKQFLSITVVLGLLAGCASTQAPAPSSRSLAPVSYTHGELNRDTLNDILVAELAGQRESYDFALDTYLNQARLTQDAGVAMRATQIAQFLNRVSDALEAVQIWRAATPEDTNPYHIEASLRLFKKQYDQALPLIRTAYKGDAHATLKLIQSQIPTMPPAVIDGYTSLLTELTDSTKPSAELWLTLSMLQTKADNSSAALVSAEEALQIDASHTASLMQKADILRSTGQLSEALAVIDAALAEQPDNKRLLLLSAQTLFDKQETETALAQVDQLHTLYADDTPLMFYLGLMTLEQEEYPHSERLFTTLMGIDRDPNRGRFYLGVIAQQQEQFDLALHRFSKVTPQAGEFMAALARTISILDSPDDKSKVEDKLTVAKALRKDLEPSLIALHAEWLEKHNYADESLAVLNNGIQQYPEETDLLYTRALRVEAFDFATTERDLKRVIAIDSKDATALNALGYTMLLNTNRYAEALEYIERALAEKPNDVSIIDSMGWAHFKLKNFVESVKYLEQAYSLSQNEEIASHLIQSLWALGEIDRAKQLLKESLQQSPNNEYLLEAAEQLNS